jgi:hypothetical protein
MVKVTERIVNRQHSFAQSNREIGFAVRNGLLSCVTVYVNTATRVKPRRLDIRTAMLVASRTIPSQRPWNRARPCNQERFAPCTGNHLYVTNVAPMAIDVKLQWQALTSRLVVDPTISKSCWPTIQTPNTPRARYNTRESLNTTRTGNAEVEAAPHSSHLLYPCNDVADLFNENTSKSDSDFTLCLVVAERQGSSTQFTPQFPCFHTLPLVTGSRSYRVIFHQCFSLPCRVSDRSRSLYN